LREEDPAVYKFKEGRGTYLDMEMMGEWEGIS